MSIVPILDATGTYTVSPPFVVDPNAVYSCIALREFRDLLNQNISVWDRYYGPYGLTQEQYDKDLAEGVILVTLYSDTAPTVYIPSSFILSYPNIGGMTVRHRVVSMSLGALPDSVPLADMMSKLAAVCSDTIGVEPRVTIHTSPVTDVLTPAKLAEIERAREARITDRTTEHAQLLEAKAIIQVQEDKIATLENYILSLPKK